MKRDVGSITKYPKEMVELFPKPSDIDGEVFKRISTEFSAEGGLFEKLIKPFKKDRNIADFMNALRTEFKNLDVTPGTMEMQFSIKFSDVLARNWEKGPEFFVSYMKNKGIKPDDNVYGSRLEAQTCLYKALMMNDGDFQDVFGQRKLL